MPDLHRCARALALLPLACSALGARAVCVTTAAQLDARLKDWNLTSSEVYSIELQQGTYDLGSIPSHYYSSYDSGASLHLLGGFLPYNGNPCGKRQRNATNTVITGSTTGDGFDVQGYGSELVVEGITFRSLGNIVRFVTRGTATLSELIVTDVYTAYNNMPALWLTPQGGYSTILQNSLVYGNHAGGGILVGNGAASNGSTVFLINNTVVQNQGAGVALGISGDPTDALVGGYNNIIWGNTDIGLKTVNANNLPTFIDTLVDTTAGSFDTQGSLLSHANPQFAAPAASPPDFSLQSNSPGINAGAPEWQVGGYTSGDLVGAPRVVGSAIDLGAYESASNDLIAQQVGNNTADDNSAGTLRSAINIANGNADATTIQFTLPGACPQVITLTAPLPDITTDVTIDGFTQTGAAANGDSSGYDGKICVIVRGNVDHALRVSGSGRLTVKGIEFEGFGTAAVRLAAGSNNQVVGNGFAAFPGSAANADGVLIEGTAKNSVVGWTDPPEHNVFDQASGYAIEIHGNGTAGGHFILGNYIGFAFDGSSWPTFSNGVGIGVVSSGGNRIESNYVGNSVSHGILLTGVNTTANALNFNVIGLAPFTRVAAGNGGAGIAFANGAHGNRIGPAAGSSAGAQNEIRDNLGPGIWLQGTAAVGVAGNGNRITGDNRVYDNNGLLAIDLGAATDSFGLGPTADDSQDADTGPNRVENYPYLTNATRFAADKISLDGYLLPEFQASSQTYRLDLFWTDTCVGSGANNDTPRGEMKRYIGNFSVPVPSNTFLKTFPYTTITAPRSIPGSGYLFATATDAAGNTSEPGPCEPFIDDYIFADGFGP